VAVAGGQVQGRVAVVVVKVDELEDFEVFEEVFTEGEMSGDASLVEAGGSVEVFGEEEFVCARR